MGERSVLYLGIIRLGLSKLSYTPLVLWVFNDAYAN